MPVGTNALELKGYYSRNNLIKSIQKNYQFFVTIWDNPISRLTLEIGPMPLITHWHVKSITVPQYPFNKETIQYGPLAKSFPTMTDFNGLDVVVTFEEDEHGTIARFINWCQSKIVRRDGTFRSQLENRIDNLMVLTEDDTGVPINLFWYRDLFFQNADAPTFDYGGNEAIAYTVTFGADIVQFLPVKSLAASGIKNNIISRILGR